MSVCVLGSINLDIVASVEELPLPGETISASSLEHFPGGKGANQAVAASRMGADTLMVGAVGTDDPGEKMLANLSGSGVDISKVISNPDQPTGQAFINVAASGENAIVIVPGANGALAPDDIAFEELTGANIFLAQLETPVAALEAFFSSDVAQAGTTIFNAAPAILEGATLFELVDILIINETELATYAGLSEVPEVEEALAASARQLRKREGQVIVVTLGSKGVLIVREDQTELIPSIVVPVLDTTGAGDCFCGALAAGLDEDLAVNDAIGLAVKAAAISVGRAGAATSMPTREEVQALIVSE